MVRRIKWGDRLANKIKKPKAIKKVQPADNFKLLDDREHVRLRPGMYIPNKDYCIYELVDNGVDILVNDEKSHLYSKKEIQVEIFIIMIVWVCMCLYLMI